MSDSTFENSSAENSLADASSPEPPRFGAVDIVEAFTAMRHEWRGQTKESLAIATQIRAATANLQAIDANLQALEAKLLARVANTPPDVEARPLALAIADADHQLSRALQVIEQWEAGQQRQAAADALGLERYFAGMSWLARRFARPLLEFAVALRPADAPPPKHPAIEGLGMILGRLGRAMRELRIERLDVAGKPFDAETMHAIGAVPSAKCPPGHVAEQLSPAYRWRGQLLRFADVRVAAGPSDGG